MYVENLPVPDFTQGPPEGRKGEGLLRVVLASSISRLLSTCNDGVIVSLKHIKWGPPTLAAVSIHRLVLGN